MQPQQVAIRVCAPGAYERVNLLALLTALTKSKVRRIESASQDREGDRTPKQHRIAAWNGGDMHALSHIGSTKATIVGNPLQRTPEEQQN